MQTTINFRISEEQKEQLQSLADQRGEKISAVLRGVITNYLDGNSSPQIQKNEVILEDVEPDLNIIYLDDFES